MSTVSSRELKHYGSVTIAQDPENPVKREILAQSIVDISTSFNKLTRSGLNRRAIVVLIADDTKFSKGAIEAVLKSLDSLAQNYTR